MTPRIIFKYSWIYDQNWREWIKVYQRKIDHYPNMRQVLNYIKKVEKLWQKEDKRILNELSKISGLKWKSKSIVCYVVGRCRAFSDPLTLSVYAKNPNRFIDVLIHELIHQLFTQNGNVNKSEKAWEYFNKKYKNETHTTKIHRGGYKTHFVVK